jgi:hypothetical protein
MNTLSTDFENYFPFSGTSENFFCIAQIPPPVFKQHAESVPKSLTLFEIMVFYKLEKFNFTEKYFHEKGAYFL